MTSCGNNTVLIIQIEIIASLEQPKIDALSVAVRDTMHASTPSMAQGAADSTNTATTFVYVLAWAGIGPMDFLSIREAKRILMEIIAVTMTFTTVLSAFPAA